jgi:hypothetical protein
LFFRLFKNRNIFFRRPGGFATTAKDFPSLVLSMVTKARIQDSEDLYYDDEFDNLENDPNMRLVTAHQGYRATPNNDFQYPRGAILTDRGNNKNKSEIRHQLHPN